MKIVPIISGGLDSTAMLYYFHAQSGFEVPAAVSFNYGQRHKKELDFAAATCNKFGIQHHVIDLYASGFTKAIEASGSSLVSSTEVPEGHYAEDNMKATVVPNRNMVMLSIAASIGVAVGADAVATGVHAGDHFIYPDCRPEFIQFASLAIMRANEDFGMNYGVVTPFINNTKADIALVALQLAVPLEETWSCYKGGEEHCGKCGTCVERLEAIDEAVRRFDPSHYEEYGTSGLDKTAYADTDFWQDVIKEANA